MIITIVLKSPSDSEMNGLTSQTMWTGEPFYLQIELFRRDANKWNSLWMNRFAEWADKIWCDWRAQMFWMWIELVILCALFLCMWSRSFCEYSSAWTLHMETINSFNRHSKSSSYKTTEKAETVKETLGFDFKSIECFFFPERMLKSSEFNFTQFFTIHRVTIAECCS